MSLERMRAPEPARDYAYSEWHRPASIARFIPQLAAQRLSMLDLDVIEIDADTNKPVAFIETTELAVAVKQARWTAAIAECAGIPGYVVQTILASHRNPHCKQVVLDIERFVVRRLRDGDTREMSVREYAEWLVDLRSRNRLAKVA